MPCVICVNTRTFPCEPDNLSNGSLSKHARKDMLLWVTDAGKSTDQNIQENGKEGTESSQPAVSEELQSGRADCNALEMSSAPSPTTTASLPGPLHTMVCKMPRKRHSKWRQPQVRSRVEKKKSNFDLSDLYTRGWSQILLDTSCPPSVCTCKGETHWLGGLTGPFEQWVLVGIHSGCSVGKEVVGGKANQLLPFCSYW